MELFVPMCAGTVSTPFAQTMEPGLTKTVYICFTFINTTV